MSRGILFGSTIATCLGCGGDVSATEIVALRRSDNDRVLLGFKHEPCGTPGTVWTDVEEAKLIKSELAGTRQQRTYQEKMLDDWAIDLGGALTVQVFENAWRYERRRFR